MIPSVYPQFTKGQDEATRETIRAIGVIFFRHCPNVKVLELNLAGPSSDEKIPENLEKILVCVKDIRLSFPSLCLIGKISITHPHEFVQELVNTGIDIIHAISSIPHDIVFPDSLPSPLAAVGGGRVSGGPASGPAFAYNKSLRKKINVPMIMGCGVIDLDDAKKYFSVGANAVSICSACHLNLEGAIKILEHYAA